VNVTMDISDKNIKIDKAHPSINKIETIRAHKDQLFLKPINEDFVTKQIKKLQGMMIFLLKIMNFAQSVI
jgi:hypothetical protein